MKEYIDNILIYKNIKLNTIVESFEQTIFETYGSMRKLYDLPFCDTIYSRNSDIRKIYRESDINYHTRILLIIEEVYKILHKSIINGNIDIFLEPLSYKNRQKYILANIESNFKITDTLFTPEELKKVSVSIPVF